MTLRIFKDRYAFSRVELLLLRGGFSIVRVRRQLTFIARPKALQTGTYSVNSNEHPVRKGDAV